MKGLLIVLFQMAVTILIGFALRKNRVIDERSQKSLSDILLQATLPFTILASSQYEYSDDIALGMMAVGACSVIYYIVTLVIVRLISKKALNDSAESRIITTTAVFANTGFVGIPLMASLFGGAGVLLAAVYNFAYNIFFYTYGAHLISGKKGNVLELILNPVSLASIAAVIMFLIPPRLPEFLADTMDLVGGVTVPLSMIILGSTLATVDYKKLFTDVKSYIVTLLRLVIFPLAMMAALLVARRFTTISDTTMITLIVMTALPSGTMNVIYADKYNTAPKFCARTVVLTLLFMMITLPLILGLSFMLNR